jgi:hypothetical protein
VPNNDDGDVNDSLSLDVARQVGGASGVVTSDQVCLKLSVSAAPLRGNTRSSTITSGSFSRATICGATNTLVEEGDYNL